MTLLCRYNCFFHLIYMKMYLTSSSELLTKGGIVRIERAMPESIVLNGKTKECKITSNTAQDKVKFYNVLLKNGNILSLGEDTVVITTDGPKKIQDVKPEDYILHKFSSLDSEKAGSLMNWESVYGANSVPIKVPKKMNKDFALWLGIVSATGRYYETSGYVGISIQDKIIARIFSELSVKVFKIKPVKYEDKLGYTQYYIYSRHMVKFLKTALGPKSNFKKVPQQLLEGSLEEQLAFIRGLTLDGYVEQGSLVVYGGVSKRLADFCAMVLRNCGHAIYQQIRKSGQGNNVYYTKIIGSHENCIPVYALEEKKNEGINEGGFLVKVTDEILNSKVPSSHPGYSALRNLRQRKSKTCYNHTLNELKIKYPENDYYVMVKEVKTEVANGFCIETESDGLLYQGVVIGSNKG